MGMFDPPKPANTDAPKELPKAGMYPARFVWMLDLGTHDETDFNDKTKIKQKHQLLLGFELSGPKMSDGRPFMVSERYTISNGKWGPYCSKSSKLRDVLKTWQGWDEKKSANLQNLAQLLGSECVVMVSVNEKKRTPGEFYAQLTAIMPLPSGMAVDSQTNPIKTFEVKAGVDTDDLPPYYAGLVQSSYEWKGEPLPPKAPVSDDVPF